MAVKIKLKRLGKIREPYYRIVVADARTKRDGRAIEEIGKYHPKAEPSLIEVNSERVQHWLSVGAQPTDPVRVLLKITGDWQKFTGEPGTEGTLRTAEPRADKKERFEAAAKESQATQGRQGRRQGEQGREQGVQARQEQCGQGQLRPRTVPPRTVPPRTVRPRTVRRTRQRRRGQLPPKDRPRLPTPPTRDADADAASEARRRGAARPPTRRTADASTADAKAAAGDPGSGA